MEPKSNFYVVILAAGHATRLRPISNRIPKPLIDIYGKTLISRIISNFRDAGFSKFCVTVGYKKELIKNELLRYRDLEILTIDQDIPTGMADAIALALKYILQKEERITSFFISAADIIFSKKEILKMYNLYTHSDIVLSLMKSSDIEIAKGHGNVKISEDSDLTKDLDDNQGLKIIDIIEKPRVNQILSEYYSLPLYLVNHEILSSMNQMEVSERGEKEFQDVLKKSLSIGMIIRGIRIIDPEITFGNVGNFHLTNLKDIINMNSRFLSEAKDNQIKGKSHNILEPVIKKSNAIIGNNVLIGPFVIIGKYCKIGDFCQLSNVILYDNAIVGKSSKLDWCIVDENVKLPENFHAEKCFITINNEKELEVINF
ncbi:MAG: sugar phosphate nucleotidyltransferase [Promethearchaeota archaeon]|jgi:bifunctional UDP-N-acetylglucosamine pyrophosphorylase/glucosamine-1-phosphate N-acetyltransferase